MVLVLLISMALLLWSIQRELDPARREPQPVGTNCPRCRAVVHDDWLVCPHCEQGLRESCRNCHHGKLISQLNCPYCGAAAERRLP